MFAQNNFYQIIAELVDIQIRSHGETREAVASALGVTESFVKKLHSPTAEKHYNVIHLFLLANHWNININELIPSMDTLGKLEKYRDCSQDALREKTNEMVVVLRKDELYE